MTMNVYTNLETCLTRGAAARSSPSSPPRPSRRYSPACCVWAHLQEHCSPPPYNTPPDFNPDRLRRDAVLPSLRPDASAAAAREWRRAGGRRARGSCVADDDNLLTDLF